MVAPTLYQYYTEGGINSGLSIEKPYFTLNGKNITLFSGAMHYFRVPKEYWRDRLRKMRHAGLNTVETYIPWNLHEPQIGQYDFGEGGSDFESFLDIKTFLKTAQEEDLFAIVRPGPYICAEWEFGGFPSWLLREPDIKLRTSHKSYMKHVQRYFGVLLKLLAIFQFTLGGPIIAFQVENEYGSTAFEKPPFQPDLSYMEDLCNIMFQNKIVELLVSSDGSYKGTVGTLPGELLLTVNFKVNASREFKKLQRFQKDKPIMVMEFWTGWYNHWSENYYENDIEEFKTTLKDILDYPASVNMYMFHGGTSFGFLNGANIQWKENGSQRYYQPDVNSYDYGAPLNEYGDYTEKYHIVKQLLKGKSRINLKIPSLPKPIPRIILPEIEVTEYLSFEAMIQQLPNPVLSENPIPMELLPINNDNGQSFGYILYRKTGIDLREKSILTIKGFVHDAVMVLINGKLISKVLNKKDDLNDFGYWRIENSALLLNQEKLKNATIDILVENLGRNNFGHLITFNQFKGLRDDVLINKKIVGNWSIYSLEFKKNWTNNLVNWTSLFPNSTMGLYKGTFKLTQTNFDTFIDTRNWIKGIVIVNGFVLGRYMKIGPPQTLYLPGPFLRKGENSIIFFEQFLPSSKINFLDHPIFCNKKIVCL